MVFLKDVFLISLDMTSSCSLFILKWFPIKEVFFLKKFIFCKKRMDNFYLRIYTSFSFLDFVIDTIFFWKSIAYIILWSITFKQFKKHYMKSMVFYKLIILFLNFSFGFIFWLEKPCFFFQYCSKNKNIFVKITY